MRAAPCIPQGQEGLFPLCCAAAKATPDASSAAAAFFWVAGEPTSVLDRRRSPSPPNSTSTLSSSLGGVAASASDKWPPALPPEDAAAPTDVMASLQQAPWGASAAASGEEQSFLHWIMAEEGAAALKLPAHSAPGLLVDSGDDNASAAAGGFDFGFVDPAGFFSPDALPIHLPQTMLLQESMDRKSVPPPPPMTPAALFPPGTVAQNLLFSKQQQQQIHTAANQPSFFMPLPPSFASPHHQSPLSPQQQPPEQLAAPPPPKRHQGGHFPTPHAAELFPLPPPLLKPKSGNAGGDHNLQVLLDQLFDAARLFEAGDLLGAREILARLNHGLFPSGKPLLRSAFYFKEALLNAVNDDNGNARALPVSSPFTVALKIGAYKEFAERSPIPQFANFTATQALLDELGDVQRIHVLDFDIGVGGQWASFMQELVHRRDFVAGNAVPVLKVTAFVSPVSLHLLEMHLVSDNLSHFAAGLGIQFEFNAVTLDSFDPRDALLGDEAVAVTLPAGAFAATADMPMPVILRLIRQLGPKVVVVIDHGGDRGDASFSQHFVQFFQSCMSLIDSIESTGVDTDTMSKIEHFLIQPRIESSILEYSRRSCNETVPPWRSLFMSAGLVPVQLSNFAEAQADCVVKRMQVRGFQAEKRQAALILYWQHSELVSVSAWRC